MLGGYWEGILGSGGVERSIAKASGAFQEGHTGAEDSGTLLSEPRARKCQRLGV